MPSQLTGFSKDSSHSAWKPSDALSWPVQVASEPQVWKLTVKLIAVPLLL
jgi:hypothetical protein